MNVSNQQLRDPKAGPVRRYTKRSAPPDARGKR